MFHGCVIKMHMHAVAKNVLHNQYYSCMRLVASDKLFVLVIV